MLNNPGDTTLHPTSVDIRVTPASPNGGIITALRICVPLGSLKKENNWGGTNNSEEQLFPFSHWQDSCLTRKTRPDCHGDQRKLKVGLKKDLLHQNSMFLSRLTSWDSLSLLKWSSIKHV